MVNILEIEFQIVFWEASVSLGGPREPSWVAGWSEEKVSGAHLLPTYFH